MKAGAISGPASVFAKILSSWRPVGPGETGAIAPACTLRLCLMSQVPCIQVFAYVFRFLIFECRFRMCLRHLLIYFMKINSALAPCGSPASRVVSPTALTGKPVSSAGSRGRVPGLPARV